ncbi:MAG TPA: asparagine synthase-related protein [Gaiellaceae bacterium]
MLSPLEIAAGFPLSRKGRLPAPIASMVEPREAFAQTMVAPLSRPPCVVSFSGGRDSSLILAAAVGVARRKGLEPPVPVTVRPVGDADPEEAAWQEVVVRDLRLDDWVRVEIGEELDCVGTEAQQALLRHGILWPPNVHFHLPQLARAAGGSVLTGVGGDEVFSSSGWARVRLVLGGRARPELRDALRIGAALSPTALRKWAATRRNDVELEWLRPAARGEVLAAVAGEAASEPVRWRQRFAWLLGLSYLDVGIRSLEALARDWNVELHHPFLDPAFVGALASLPRGRRFSDRTEALAGLFGDLLPAGLESRRSKAAFTETLWGAPSRALAAAWDGSGVDADIVDIEALRCRWQVEGAIGPHTLLQSIWLESERARQASASVPSTSSRVSGSDAQERGRRSSQAGKALS